MKFDLKYYHVGAKCRGTVFQSRTLPCRRYLSNWFSLARISYSTIKLLSVRDNNNLLTHKKTHSLIMPEILREKFTCLNCRKTRAKFMCGRCHSVDYCGKKCRQKKDLKRRTKLCAPVCSRRWIIEVDDWLLLRISKWET